jgi:hypothetical protein
MVEGTCDHPKTVGKTIQILDNKKISSKRKLEVCIHEVLHAALWDLSEEAVDETSKSIADILWRLSYRQMEE